MKCKHYDALSGRHGIEDLPDDVINIILGNQTETRSLAHFAMASRRCREAAARADQIRKWDMPVTDHHQVLHPANVEFAQSAPKEFTHCLRCFMCKSLVPVPLGAVVIDHQCANHTYQHPMPYAPLHA